MALRSSPWPDRPGAQSSVRTHHRRSPALHSSVTVTYVVASLVRLRRPASEVWCDPSPSSAPPPSWRHRHSSGPLMRGFASRRPRSAAFPVHPGGGAPEWLLPRPRPRSPSVWRSQPRDGYARSRCNAASRSGPDSIWGAPKSNGRTLFCQVYTGESRFVYSPAVRTQGCSSNW